MNLYFYTFIYMEHIFLVIIQASIYSIFLYCLPNFTLRLETYKIIQFSNTFFFILNIIKIEHNYNLLTPIF
jgi:hypothetical protein